MRLIKTKHNVTYTNICLQIDRWVLFNNKQKLRPTKTDEQNNKYFEILPNPMIKSLKKNIISKVIKLKVTREKKK